MKKSHEQRSKYREINLNQCKKTDDGQTEVCTFHVTVYISELSLSVKDSFDDRHEPVSKDQGNPKTCQDPCTNPD